jgi:hypothetical protein
MPRESPRHGFIESMSSKADEEYEAAFDETLDSCLKCDLFAWQDESVVCRMNRDPVQCGGPYRRVGK